MSLSLSLIYNNASHVFSGLVMRLLGKIVIALLALILLASTALWTFSQYIKPETLQRLVSNQLSAITHKKSQVDGGISWQLLPRPGLKFNKIRIGDPLARDEYIINIETLLLNLRLTALLRGQIVFSELRIEGINAVIDGDSVTEPAAEAKLHEQKSASTNPLAIEQLRITRGQLTLKKNNQTAVFKNIQIGSDQFNLNNHLVPMQIKARLANSSYQPIMKAQLNFKGRVNLSLFLQSNPAQSGLNSFIDGQLSLDRVLINQFAIKKIGATIKTKNDLIVLNPLTISLYNGESIGDLNYAVASKILTINQTGTNLDGKSVITALLGRELVSGSLDYSLHATIPLAKNDIKSSIGKGNITIKNGQLYQVNMEELLDGLRDKLLQYLDKSQLNLKKIAQLADDKLNKNKQGITPFQLISLHYQLHNGQLSSDTMLLQTDKMQIAGAGTLDLITQQIQFILHASVTNNDDNTLMTVQRLLGGYFPLLVKGTLVSPEISPDVKAIAPVLRQLLLKKTLDKPIKLLKDFIH